jgi:tRNA(His) guanylyltransferase
MNAAAAEVLRSIPEITLSYGVSDEFSFVLPPHSTLFDRREAKLVSTVVSTFTGWYVFLWERHMPGVELEAPPSFDGRAVCYPSVANLRDYLCWRQVDCMAFFSSLFFLLPFPPFAYEVREANAELGHINNLYNTAFWALVLQGGMSNQQAEEELKVCSPPKSVKGGGREVEWKREGHVVRGQERNTVFPLWD